MKKRSLLLGGALMFAMTFSTTIFTACHNDDKENEIVEDPLKTKTEYYIVGTVMDANSAVAGAKVEIDGTNNATTDANGVYTLTVEETGTYTVKFSANGLESYESQINIANGAANRTQVTLNVKLAEAIDMQKGASVKVTEGEDASINVPNQETKDIEAVINIPSGAATDETTVSAVVYEEAQTIQAEETSTSVQNITTSVSNVAVQTTPANATAQKDIEISIPNAADEDNHFDTEYMEALKDDAETRAGTAFGDILFKNNRYVITIPEGEKIAGKYSFNLQYSKKAESTKAGNYNKVNEQNGVVKFENRDYSAQNVTLEVEMTSGWQYTTAPEEALRAVGASDKLAAAIKGYIENNEGKEGTYSIRKTLTASISGNHVLYFGSKAKVQEKTYTFHIIVKGEKKTVSIKLLCYVGHTEDYTNGPISQHSGGTTGGQN